jgi:hypothetical protein
MARLQYFRLVIRTVARWILEQGNNNIEEERRVIAAEEVVMGAGAKGLLLCKKA